MKKKKHGKVQQRSRVFTEDFKRRVCAEYLHGSCSMEFLRRKYKIKGHSAIRNWLDVFSDIASVNLKRNGMESSNTAQQPIETTLEEENARLKAEVASLQTDKLLLEASLEIISEDYGIEWAKKSEAGRLKK